MQKINIRGPIVDSSEKYYYDMFEMDATCIDDVEKVLNEYPNEDIEVYINSPGGYVDVGSEIYSLLKDHKGKIIVKITGTAASAASVVAMAGDVIKIAPTARIMIHNASSSVSGDYRSMEHGSEVLKHCNKSISNAYRIKTGMETDELLKLMDKETYMDAEKAKQLGFVDEILFDENRLLNNLGMCMIPKNIIEKLRNKEKLKDNKHEKSEKELNEMKNRLSYMSKNIDSFLFCQNIRGNSNE